MSVTVRSSPHDVIASLDLGVGPVSRLLKRIQIWMAQRQAAAHLHELSDHVLADIGITRAEIDLLVSGHLGRC